jgi:uncharacterized protein with FMN-binding domain
MSMPRRILYASTAALPVLAGAAPALASSTRSYTGSRITDGYATATVTIAVSRGRITSISANVGAHAPLSRELDARAVPELKAAALRAQSVAGIHKVSGASQTSYAFKRSLAAAMREAHLKGA